MKSTKNSIMAVGAMLMAVATHASDCDRTSVGFTPIDDLGTGMYLKQFQGGLYPDGANDPPPDHALTGRNRARGIRSLDANGDPDTDGRYVMLSIGMSNTTQEFCSQNGREPCDPWTFMGQAADHPMVNDTTLVIVNGARGGQSAGDWESPDHANYDRVRDEVLGPKGLTEAQVQIVWVKVANPRPTVSLPAGNADAYHLVRQMGNIARTLKVRYPNVRMVFLSSRIYAGYATTDLNPEPYAYESAFAVKWLIEAQIDQMAGGGVDPRAGDLNIDGVAPWLGWAAHLWADGLVPRSDGLIWECLDMQSDGTHPARSGEEKVGTALLDTFLQSPFSRPWFVVGSKPCERADIDEDDIVGLGDVLSVLAAWGPCENCREDLDRNGLVDLADLLFVLSNWGPCE